MHVQDVHVQCTRTCDCDEGDFNGPGCFTRATTCSNHGTPSWLGRCVCDRHYAGTICQHGDDELCHSNGRALYNGTCSCRPGYDSTPGTDCGIPWACTEHGTTGEGGSCDCNQYWYGEVCQCFDYGTTGAASGTCTICAPGWELRSGLCVRSVCPIDAVGLDCQVCCRVVGLLGCRRRASVGWMRSMNRSSQDRSAFARGLVFLAGHGVVGVSVGHVRCDGL